MSAGDRRDQRDPQKLGRAILNRIRRAPNRSACNAADWVQEHVLVPDHDAEHMGPIEKYGDPRKLPPTMP